MVCNVGVHAVGVIERPEIYLDFEGADGNTLALVGKCVRVARKSGWTREAIEGFRTEALSHNREHVLDTIFEYFVVCQIKYTADVISRDGVS